LITVFSAGCATSERGLATSQFYGYKNENFSHQGKRVFVTALTTERANRSQYIILRESLNTKLKSIGMSPVEKISSPTDYVAIFDMEMDSHGDGYEKLYFLEFYSVTNGVINRSTKLVDLTMKRTGMNMDVVAEGEAALSDIFSEFPRKSTYNTVKK